MHVSSSHLCFSHSPSCSGSVPCVVCMRFLIDNILPRAMFLAGPPFNASPDAAAAFMRAFAQAMRDGAEHARQNVEPTLAREHVQRSQGPMPIVERPELEPAPVMTEEEYLFLFAKQITEGAKTMTPEHRGLMGKGVNEGTLEGWQALNEAEKNVMRRVFCPETPQMVSVEVPEDEPLPSNESAMKVVEALRQGTLSPTTLDVAPPPSPAQQEPPAASVADQAPGRAPPPASPEGHVAGLNGSEQVPAQVAVAKESITS